MKNKDLIAFPKEDNWNKFDYNFRIFDALASLFHFKSACSGVFKGKDYNGTQKLDKKIEKSRYNIS